MSALKIDFMGKRLMATFLSGALLLVALGSLLFQGLNLHLSVLQLLKELERGLVGHVNFFFEFKDVL